jgi:hypothetical protein
MRIRHKFPLAGSASNEPCEIVPGRQSPDEIEGQDKSGSVVDVRDDILCLVCTDHPVGSIADVAPLDQAVVVAISKSI